MPRNLSGSLESKLARRNELLADSDWLMLRHRDQIDSGIPTTLTQEQFEETLVYRQALRDWDRVSALPTAPLFL